MNTNHNHSPSVAESMEAHMGAGPTDVVEVGSTFVGRLNERTLEVVRERPILCLMGALAAGFVVGKIAARY